MARSTARRRIIGGTLCSLVLLLPVLAGASGDGGDGAQDAAAAGAKREGGEGGTASAPVEVRLGIQTDAQFVLGISSTYDASLGKRLAMQVAAEAVAAGDADGGLGPERVVVTDAEGMQLECFLPASPPPEDVPDEAPSSAASASGGLDEDGVAGDAASVESFAERHLSASTAANCHLKSAGWWTYEVCPTKHVKQFHIEGGRKVTEFVLGVFNPQKTRELVRRFERGEAAPGSGEGFAFAYDGGTTCDLNQQPRSTEVKFVCASQSNKDGIRTIKEVVTCQYEVIFESAELCKHPAFIKKERDIKQIQCQPLFS